MTIDDAKRVIERMAKEAGVTPEEVRGDITEAIEAGYLHGDPERWNQLKISGKLPSPEEFLIQMTTMVRQNMINRTN